MKLREPQPSTLIITPPAAPAPGPMPNAAIRPDDLQGHLHIDNQRTTDAIVQAIDGARDVVTVEMFAIGPTGSGEVLGDALVRAAHRGVDTMLLADKNSYTMLPVPFVSFPRWVSKLRAAGVQVHVTHLFGDHPKAGKVIDHRKVVIADEKAFVGGMGFAKFMDGWHDAMFELTGPAASAVAQNNLQRLREVGMTISPRHEALVGAAAQAAAAADASPSQFKLVANSPHQQEWDLSRHYTDRIAGATSRIWLTTLAVSDQDIVDSLAAAARRGVDVRVVTPGRPPMTSLIRNATRASLRRAIDAGVKVYETPGTIHFKAMVVDDEATIGSYNLTKRSAKADAEIGVVSRTSGIRRQVEDVLQHNFDRSPRLHTDQIKGSIAQALFDRVLGKWHFSY